MSENRVVLVYTTLANPEQARQLGNALVQEKLAACVNVFPGMISIYQWRGALEETPETAMIIKTSALMLDQLLSRAEALHPYQTPALLVLPIERANADFANWVAAQTGESAS